MKNTGFIKRLTLSVFGWLVMASGFCFNPATHYLDDAIFRVAPGDSLFIEWAASASKTTCGTKQCNAPQLDTVTVKFDLKFQELKILDGLKEGVLPYYTNVWDMGDGNIIYDTVRIDTSNLVRDPVTQKRYHNHRFVYHFTTDPATPPQLFSSGVYSDDDPPPKRTSISSNDYIKLKSTLGKLPSYTPRVLPSTHSSSKRVHINFNHAPVAGENLIGEIQFSNKYTFDVQQDLLMQNGYIVILHNLSKYAASSQQGVTVEKGMQRAYSDFDTVNYYTYTEFNEMLKTTVGFSNLPDNEFTNVIVGQFSNLEISELRNLLIPYFLPSSMQVNTQSEAVFMAIMCSDFNNLARQTDLIEVKNDSNQVIDDVVNLEEGGSSNKKEGSNQLDFAQDFQETELADSLVETPTFAFDLFKARFLNSHDPNSITVVPEKICSSDSKLFYTVNFQNYGTGFARDIELLIDLDPHIDTSSVDILNNSIGRIKSRQISPANNQLSVKLDSLLLGPIGSEEAISFGQLVFSAGLGNTLKQGDRITTDAQIIFDSNPPVRVPKPAVTNFSPKSCNRKIRLGLRGGLNLPFEMNDLAFSKVEDNLFGDLYVEYFPNNNAFHLRLEAGIGLLGLTDESDVDHRAFLGNATLQARTYFTSRFSGGVGLGGHYLINATANGVEVTNTTGLYDDFYYSAFVDLNFDLLERTIDNKFGIHAGLRPSIYIDPTYAGRNASVWFVPQVYLLFDYFF